MNIAQIDAEIVRLVNDKYDIEANINRLIFIRKMMSRGFTYNESAAKVDSMFRA